MRRLKSSYWGMRNNMAGLNPFIYHSTCLFMIQRKTQFVPHIAYQNTVDKTTCKPQNVQMPHTVDHSKKEAKTTNQYMITSGRHRNLIDIKNNKLVNFHCHLINGYFDPSIYHSAFLFIIRRKTQFVPHITSGGQRDILNGWKVINKEMTGLWSFVIYDKRNTTNNLYAIHVYNTPA